jgi:hypothetical protein
MNCPECRAPNDADALFCAACGRPLEDAQPKPVSNQRRAYFIALLFIPVVLIAAAIGYYKFYLPGGVAAVVNGEEITLSELDAAVARMQGSRDAAAAGLRSQALNELISERLVLQEARKAGIAVSKEALASAAADAQAASGLDAAAFDRAMSTRYGNVRGFEKDLERRILINRLIAERIVPPGADPGTAGRAVNQWLQGLSDKATVRIALAEQLSGPGCSCCSTSGERVKNGRGMPGHGCPAAKEKSAGADQAKAAADAALRFWHEKHGPEAVTTKAADYGCHVQVDIIQNNRIIGSLRYQDGNISEQ